MYSNVSCITAILGKAIGILRKSRHILPLHILKAFDNSLFLPYIAYGTFIWDSTYSSYLEPLYRLLKKAIHTITFLHLSSQSKSLFCKLQVLSVHSIYKFQVSSFVFAHFNNLLLAPLSSLLQFNCDYRDSQIRSR